MSSISVILILLSCFLHAGWNFASKSKNPSAAFFTIALSSALILFSPLLLYFVPYYPEVPAKVWMLLMMTGVVMAFYFICLGNAYRTNEMSLAYPITQSVPVLLVPLVTTALGFGQLLSPLALVGMGITALGCIVLPLNSLHWSQTKVLFHYSFLFILGTAIGTTGYSIIDSEALSLLGSAAPSFTPLKAAAFYITFQYLFAAPFMWAYTVLSRRDRIMLKVIKKRSLPLTLTAGPAAGITYAIVLLAMQYATNVSYIVAFRQMGIIIGFFLGVVILKEKSTPFKIIGTALIFCGLVLTKIG